MHLLLTDRLTCPRCGPTFGLILLASRMNDRAVVEGELGCPNCRDTFRITDGFADLRAPPRTEPSGGLAGEPPDKSSNDEGSADSEAAVAPRAAADEARRLPALLGVVGGPGTITLVGAPARHAEAVVEVSEEIHVVGVDPDLRTWPERPRISRMMAAPGLPFFDATLRAVAVDGRLGSKWVEEAVRTVVPRGRLVVVHAPEGTDDVLRAAGLTVLASEAETVVATRG